MYNKINIKDWNEDLMNENYKNKWLCLTGCSEWCGYNFPSCMSSFFIFRSHMVARFLRLEKGVAYSPLPQCMGGRWARSRISVPINHRSAILTYISWVDAVWTHPCTMEERTFTAGFYFQSILNMDAEKRELIGHYISII